MKEEEEEGEEKKKEGGGKRWRRHRHLYIWVLGVDEPSHNPHELPSRLLEEGLAFCFH